MDPNERHGDGEVGPNVNATKPELVGPTHLFPCLERDRTYPINFHACIIIIYYNHKPFI